MATVFNIDEKDEVIRTLLIKSLQSGNINYFLGAGASLPAVNVAGKIEREIEALFKAGKDFDANKKIYDFLLSLQYPTNLIIDDKPGEDETATISNYSDFIEIAEKILASRKTNILPKQANIFTTNYDLFIEKACEKFPILKLNDGFSRTPNLKNTHVFDPKTFFNTVYNNGNLYNYKVEIPTINLIKIHGSLSWNKSDKDIYMDISKKKASDGELTEEKINEFNSRFSIVLPRKSKFEETMMDRIYYSLLRIYANELDKENTILISYGFSFLDEHIKDITLRSLKNPTLNLIIFSHSSESTEKYIKIFHGYNNVKIISPSEGQHITFNEFNNSMIEVIPK